MSERLPPAIAVLFDEAIRPAALARLNPFAPRVSWIRFDTSASGALKNAFIEELRQKMSLAAAFLRPDLAPALMMVMVTNPDLALPPGGEIVDSIRKACPPNVAFVVQWLGLFRVEELPQWQRRTLAGSVFLLSSNWRGEIQGPALREAYCSLVVCLLASESALNDLAPLRYQSSGKLFKIAIDRMALPNFNMEAERLLRLSTLSSYFPAIDDRARQAALRLAPAEIDPLLQLPGSRAAIEPRVAEPLLCAAIGRSVSLMQVAAMLGDWTAAAAAPIAELLRDLRVALTQWMVQGRALNFDTADPALSRVLFEAGGFPCLHELRAQLTAYRTESAFRARVKALSKELADRKRDELNVQYFEFLPHDLNDAQKLALTAELANASGWAKRVVVTRHFPRPLHEDMREVALTLDDFTAVLYALEMRTA